MVSFENTAIAFKSKNNKSLRRTYLLFKAMSAEKLVGFGSALLNFALKIRLPVKGLIKRTLFKQFCGGESIEDCNDRIQELSDYNIKTILDYSVEGIESEKEFESNKKEIIATINKAKEDSRIPFSVFKVTGVARFKVLHKMSTGEKMNEKEQKSRDEIIRRVDEICSEAHSKDVPVFIDAEESWIQPAIDKLAFDMMLKYNTKSAIVYNTVQLYRHDRLVYIHNLVNQCREAGIKLGLKLVRGAYMEKERDRAKDRSYESPIQPDKEATDRDFDAAVAYCIENRDIVSFCCGSHNESSNLLVVDLMKNSGMSPDDSRVYFAQLLGMSDHISYNLSSAGYNVAKYVPYGPVREVMPYLMRRAEENTSIAGQTGRELMLIEKEIKRRKSEDT